MLCHVSEADSMSDYHFFITRYHAHETTKLLFIVLYSIEVCCVVLYSVVLPEIPVSQMFQNLDVQHIVIL